VTGPAVLPETGDILHLAEPLKGVADLGDETVVRFLAGLGDRLGHLARCEGREAVIEAVSIERPDYVLLGGKLSAADLGHLRAAMHTATLGVVILRETTQPTDLPEDIPAQIELESLDVAAGLNAFTLHVRALMRRCRPVALGGRLGPGVVTLDEAAMTLSTPTATATLSLEDFRLLGPLFDVPGQVWPREALLRLAYGAQTANGLRTVDVKLNRTRRRLRAALGQDPVRSVRGSGYILDLAGG
jgi:two-component system phosphate regulon response regulator PhoB